ncbi:MAG: ABC transporter permease [Rhodospirillaceae bacterium]|jgi:D-methionine transport system permease protein|nr:ABC transporter permease [Rhodospirillaceae bacterium]
MSTTIIELLFDALLETILMVGASSILSALIGIPLGVILMVTCEKQILENKSINRILGTVVNATRSTPFIILLVVIIPFTRIIAGTSIGTIAAIVPLTIAAIPFISRLVEASLTKVDTGLIEAAEAMGASPLQIIVKVLLPEARSGIVTDLTTTVINLIGYSAMAGVVGGGGLGDVGIRYGYQRFCLEVMILVVIILIVLVQIIQSFGDFFAKKLTKRSTRS